MRYGIPGLITALLCLSCAASAQTRTEPLEEVIVTATRKETLNEATDQTTKLLKVPASFGDPMQTIFALPGVVQTSEGRPNPAVRGSGPAGQCVSGRCPTGRCDFSSGNGQQYFCRRSAA